MVSACALEEIATCSAMNCFHLFVRRWMKGRQDKRRADRYAPESGDRELILICDEVGCGLVPVDAFEREYREAVGRICTVFARRADRVDRVVCGNRDTDQIEFRQPTVYDQAGKRRKSDLLTELEQVLPADIEKRSFEIITEELGDKVLIPGTEPIVKRCIHTSARL